MSSDNEEKYTYLIGLNAFLCLASAVLTFGFSLDIASLSVASIATLTCLLSHIKLTWKEYRILLRIFLTVNLICLAVVVPKVLAG